MYVYQNKCLFDLLHKHNCPDLFSNTHEYILILHVLRPIVKEVCGDGDENCFQFIL